MAARLRGGCDEKRSQDVANSARDPVGRRGGDARSDSGGPEVVGRLQQARTPHWEWHRLARCSDRRTQVERCDERRCAGVRPRSAVPRGFARDRSQATDRGDAAAFATFRGPGFGISETRCRSDGVDTGARRKLLGRGRSVGPRACEDIHQPGDGIPHEVTRVGGFAVGKRGRAMSATEICALPVTGGGLSVRWIQRCLRAHRSERFAFRRGHASRASRGRKCVSQKSFPCSPRRVMI